MSGRRLQSFTGSKLRMLSKERQTKHERERPDLTRRLRLPETAILVLGLICLVLVGPLRDILSAAPVLLFLATLALFMVPGVLLSSLFLERNFLGVAQIPVAFVISASLFGLWAVPVLVLHWSLDSYLWICGGILVVSLGLAAFRAVRKGSPAKAEPEPATDSLTNWLWAPCLGLVGVAAYASSVARELTNQIPEVDHWVYLAYIREFLNTDKLGFYDPGSGAETSGLLQRLVINGWLVEQAAFSRVSGIDPVELVSEYLAPALIVVALLAFYALARILFENKTAALLAGSFYALFLLVSFNGSLVPYSLLGSDNPLLHILEDKYVARFIFLPVALSFSVLFLRERKLRYLILFTFVCWSVVTIHPLGLVFIGVSLAGFGLVHLALNWREWRTYTSFGALGAAMLSLGVPPAVYLVAVGKLSRVDSDLENSNSTIFRNLIDQFQARELLLVLGEGSYIMHPSFLLHPAMLAAYLLGVPFLLWRLKKSLAAQLLLGVLLFVPVLIFIPLIASFIGEIIGPWTLYRLAWPISLAAMLTLSWMIWELLEYARAKLGGPSALRRAVPYLPLILMSALIVGAAPAVAQQVRSADALGETPQEQSTCSDPIFGWMQGAITEPGVVLAPTWENRCIVPYAAQANVVEFYWRDEHPQNEEDVLKFFNAPALDEEMVETIQRHGVDYVLLSVNSPLNQQLGHSPGFTAMDNPGDRYRLYRVDRTELEVTPTVAANGFLNEQDWAAAISSYNEALRQGDEDERFLAYIGLGKAYLEEKQLAESISSYESAVGLNPDDLALYSLLVSAYSRAGNPESARAALEQAVELAPKRVEFRSQLGNSMVIRDPQETVNQYRTIVEMYPEVPKYRVDLGRTLNLTGDFEAADREFERAIYLNPLSEGLYVDIGRANLTADRLEEASRYYERVVELNPESQVYTLELGRIYSLLSTANGWDEEYYERAEQALKSVLELEPLAQWERGALQRYKDLGGEAELALDNLYYNWNQPEEAAAAYERALEYDPDSEVAKERLQEVQPER